MMYVLSYKWEHNDQCVMIPGGVLPEKLGRGVRPAS